MASLPVTSPWPREDLVELAMLQRLHQANDPDFDRHYAELTALQALRQAAREQRPVSEAQLIAALDGKDHDGILRWIGGLARPLLTPGACSRIAASVGAVFISATLAGHALPAYAASHGSPGGQAAYTPAPGLHAGAPHDWLVHPDPLLMLNPGVLIARLVGDLVQELPVETGISYAQAEAQAEQRRQAMRDALRDYYDQLPADVTWVGLTSRLAGMPGSEPAPLRPEEILEQMLRLQHPPSESEARELMREAVRTAGHDPFVAQLAVHVINAYGMHPQEAQAIGLGHASALAGPLMPGLAAHAQRIDPVRLMENPHVSADQRDQAIKSAGAAACLARCDQERLAQALHQIPAGSLGQELTALLPLLASQADGIGAGPLLTAIAQRADLPGDLRQQARKLAAKRQDKGRVSVPRAVRQAGGPQH